MLNNMQQKRVVTGRQSVSWCTKKWWFTAVAVAGLVLPANPACGWGVGTLVQSSILGFDVKDHGAEKVADRSAIIAKFRSAKLFTDAWYRDHPTAWRPSTAAATTAALTTWDAVAEWLTVTGDPVYYGYGDNVIVTDTGVYFSGLRAASLFDYTQAAAELAAAGAKKPAKTARWRSLGTFALVPPQRFNARAYVTLSVSRVGFMRGTYVDALTMQPVPIIGAVDRAYQRVAWTTGEKGTTVFDTGLDNLTRATAPLLVHYETKRTEQWLTVRVRTDDGQDPPAAPPGEE